MAASFQVEGNTRTSFKPEDFDRTQLGSDNDLHGLFESFDLAITRKHKYADAVVEAFCNLITSDKRIWMVAAVHFVELRGQYTTQANGANAMRYKILHRTRSYRHKLYCNCQMDILQRLFGYAKTNWRTFSTNFEPSANKEDQQRIEQVHTLFEELECMFRCRDASFGLC